MKIYMSFICRYVYWTDWGLPAKVERASMDGKNRIILVSSELEAPYGITIDYIEQKIYWVDAQLDKIEYSNIDGSGRVTLTTLPQGLGLGTPYSLTLEGNFLYWTEWVNNAIYSVHKGGGNVSVVLGGLLVNPNGIQTVSASRRLYSECNWNTLRHAFTLVEIFLERIVFPTHEYLG